MAKYIYDFADYTAVHGPLPKHPNGQQKVHTWLWGGAWCPCDGRDTYGPPCPCEGILHPNYGAQEQRGAVPHPDDSGDHVCECGGELHPEYGPQPARAAAPHGQYAGHPAVHYKHAVRFGKDERIDAGTVVEADLEDGSYRSEQIKDHLRRRACREASPAEGG